MASTPSSIPSTMATSSSFIHTSPRKKKLEAMKLEDSVLATFEVAKAFSDNSSRINSIDYSSNGDFLITASDDDSINIYDCGEGAHRGTLYSKKYGVDLIHYTHAHNMVIHSSNKVDNSVRYLDMHENKYVRYFKDHTKKVVTVAMSPIDDTFLTGSLDKTIRLWDLRAPTCQGILNLVGRPVGSIDPEGLIFAVGINSETVKLFDIRTLQPFNTFKLQQDKKCDWTGLKFSPDGQKIMLYTNGPIIHIIHAFSGTPVHTLTGHVNNKGASLEASFSPDSDFIVSGSSDGRIFSWDAKTGARVVVFSTKHHADDKNEKIKRPVHCVQFNPKYLLMVSTCHNLNFWTPAEF